MSVEPSKVKSIFLKAVEECSPNQWDTFLEDACEGDADLLRRVRVLIRAHVGEDHLFDDLSSDDRPISELPGTQIGLYKLLEQIGEGGMGVVYRAEQQEPVRREVALKIVKPGMDTRDVISRFGVEQQALAMMNHPNIAKVLGAGSTESGRPYFVMELVEGVPLTQYADQHQLNTRQRLKLFRAVCEAVQHAHQKGIIHRDIKPSNVLVASDGAGPVPKIIDFGIAKAVKGELSNVVVNTGHGQIMGTPMYMSPEQAGLDSTDIDTRTDIYSLGVVLYELLAGKTPFDEDRLREASYEEVRRLIREEEPPSPSAMVNTLGQAATTISSHRQVDPHKLHRLLRGELDWIVIKALEKDRDRRYATASSLARDIQSYLDDEPVEACPPSRLYQFQKFARRNKVVLVSVLMVATSLIVGAGIATWKSIEATRKGDLATQKSRIAAQEKNNADRAKDEAEELANLGLEVLDDIYLNVLGDRLARQQQLPAEQRQLLQTGLDYYEQFVKRTGDAPGSALVIANAQRQVGLIYGRLGDREKEEGAYRQAIQTYERLTAIEPHEPELEYRLALALGSLMENQAALGRVQQAQPAGSRAIEILKRLHNEHPDRADFGMALAGMHNQLAWALASVLPSRGIIEHHQAAIRLFEQLALDFPHAQLPGELPYDDPLDGAAHSRLLLAQTAQDEEAIDSLRVSALRHFQAKVRRNPLSQWHRAQLAEVSLTLRGGNVRDAVGVLEELHSEFPSVPSHKFRLACASERLGNALRHDAQQVQEAQRYLRRAVQLLTELVQDFPNTPDYHSQLAAAMGDLMGLPRSVIDLDEARQLIELAIDRQTDAVKVNPGHRKYREHLADHFASLAVVLEELGAGERVDESHIRRIELLNDLRREDSAAYEDQFRQSRLDYADWLTRHGDYEDAEELYREMIAAWAPDMGPEEPDPLTQSLLGSALHGLGNVSLANRKLDEARQVFQQAIVHQEAALVARMDRGRCKELLCRHLCRLGTVQSELGQQDLARHSWERAIEIFSDLADTGSLAVHEDVAWVLIGNPETFAPPTVIAIAEDALQRAPFSYPLWTALGAARCRSGKWLEAIDSLHEADRLGDGDSCTSFFLAIANWQLGERPTAGDWYGQAVEDLPVHGIWRAALQRIREETDASIGPAIAIRGAEQREGTGEFTTAFVFTITRFGDISGSVAIDWATSDGTARAGRDYVPVAGQLHQSAGNTRQTITIAVHPDFMVEPTEDFVVSLVDVAGAEVAQRRAIGTIVNDDQPESIDKWNRALRYRDGSPVAHFKRAVAYSGDPDHDSDALADLSRAIELAPDFAKAYFLRGVIRQRQGELAAALSDAEQAIVHGYQTAASFSDRGVLRSALSTTGLEAALSDFDRAIEIGPARAEFYNNRGIVHAQRGSLNLAVADFDEAVRLCPDLLPAHANRVLARAASGQVEAALRDIRQLSVRAAEWTQNDMLPCQWVPVPGLEGESLRRFRDEAAAFLRSTNSDSTAENGANNTEEKGAGEPTLATKKLTGQASLERFVCTPGKMTMAILSQTVDLSQQEYHAMLIAQMKKRVQVRRRQLRLEQLEQRNLLTGTISGTVFEDLNGDGVQDPGEPGMVGETVVLESTAIDAPLVAIPGPPVPDANFGFSFEATGNYIFAGASNGDFDGVVGAGRAYLFDSTTGDIVQTFDSPEPTEGEYFGTSFAINGDKILIGTRHDRVRDENDLGLVGVAYLFDIASGEMELAIHDPTPATVPGSTDQYFGSSITSLAVFRGGYLIGDAHDDAAGEGSGSVHFFDSSGGLVWTIANPSPEPIDWFGMTVEVVDDQRIAICAIEDNTRGVDAGAVYIYDTTTRELLQTIYSPNPQPGGQFGKNMVVSGDYLLIGSFAEEAYLFDTDGEYIRTFTSPNPHDGDEFGVHLTIDGDKAIISSRKDDTGADDAGAAYLFDLDTGQVLHSYYNPTPEALDWFGRNVLLLENGNIAISCRRDDIGGTDTGAIYIYSSAHSELTNASGDYSFNSRSPDDYVLRQITPDGYSQTTPVGNGTHHITLGDGSDVTGVDFGNQWDPDVLFADSFENGQWNGLWVEDSQNDWFTSTQRATDGSYAAEVDGYASNATLTTANPIDLTPYGGAELTFDWYVEKGFDSGEYLALDLFDGSSWIEAARLSGNVDQENTWHNGAITVGAGYLVDDFQFRFRAKTSRYNEDANVDNVQLVATSLATPPNIDPTAGNDTATTDEDNVVIIPVMANDTDSDGDPLTIASVTQGALGTVTINADNTLTYTPTADRNGADVFTYTVSDGNGGTDAGSVTITVNAVNDAPLADALAAATKENQPLSLTLTASDVENDALSYAIVDPPVNGSLTGTAPNLTFTPNTDFTGPATFTFQVNDGDLDSNLATVTIDVAANHVPQADDQSVNVNEDGLVAITLTADDADGDPLTFTVVTVPASGVLTGTAPNLTYTPSADYNGSDSFAFRVNDGTDDSVLATVSIIVGPVNDAPVADDASVTTAEDTAVNVTLTGSDIDADALGFVISTQPSQGTLSGSGANRIYTPAADYHGSDSFSFVANDGTVDSFWATVSLTVTAVNDAPVADALVAATDQGTAVGITLTASDVDPDPLGFTVVAEPSNGTLSGTAPNLQYTPTGDFTGDDSFTFVANDGTVDSNVATVSVTVAAVATGPNLTHGVVSDVGSDWITVDLGTTYGSMVVIATPNYDSSSYPGVVRIQNAAGGSFDVRIDAAGPNAPDLMDVYYVVVEEGVYDEPGFKLEAVKFTSTVTDEDNSWTGESRTYQQSYTAPVVVGQVMTSNDAWSVFWAAGSSRTAPPTSTALTVGKMVGEDSDTTRADETIGYLVIESSSSGTDEIEGLPYVAGVGSDTVKGPTNSPPFTYNYNAMPNAKTAVVSLAGMDGGNGGWALLYGPTPVPASSGTLSLVVDEDQVADSERSHTTEQVAYFVIDPPVVADVIVDPPQETIRAQITHWPGVIVTHMGEHQRAAQVIVIHEAVHGELHELREPWTDVLLLTSPSEALPRAGQETQSNDAVTPRARRAAFANWGNDEQLCELFEDDLFPLSELGRRL